MMNPCPALRALRLSRCWKATRVCPTSCYRARPPLAGVLRRALLVGALGLLPQLARAQTPPAPTLASSQPAPSWGLTLSVVPDWNVPKRAERWFDRTVAIDGAEFRVGVVRGRPLANQWGITYVHKHVNRGSRLDDEASEYCFVSECLDTTTQFVAQGTSLNGVEVHNFIPLATVKSRVRIGVTVAGGIAGVAGQVDAHRQEVAFGPFRTVEQITRERAADAIGMSVMPLLRAEIGAAFALSRTTNLHVSGGINTPGYHVISVSGVYFFRPAR